MEGLEKTASQPPQWLLVSILHRVACLFSLLYSKPLTHTAPSAAPSNVRVTEVTSSTITVEWGEVACMEHNGEITGYSVRYGVQGQSTQTMSVSGGDTTMTTIRNLMLSTTYSIEVAAVNDIDIGQYSESFTIKTLRSK